MFYLILLFGMYFFVSLFCLTLCLYVLCISTMYPSLERVVLVETVLCRAMIKSPLHQGYPLCGLHLSSCCGWAAIATGMLLIGVGIQASWLQGPAASTICMLVCQASPLELQPLGGISVGCSDPLGRVGLE